jgi:putative membrane protein
MMLPDWRPAAAALLALGLGALATAEEPMQPSRTMQAVMDDDVKDFFETAGSAGIFEIAAGELAQVKGTSPEVKSYGEKMVSDHKRAAGELRELARDKGAVLPPDMLKRHRKMLDRLKEAEPGKDFDDAYRRHMIASHKEAVSLFDEASRKAADADIQAFAAKVLPLLQHHGSMAERLPKS